MTMIVLIGLLAMCLIITFEARLFDENRALEDKAFNVMEQFTNE